jgi:hypothetical protein
MTRRGIVFLSDSRPTLEFGKRDVDLVGEDFVVGEGEAEM